MNERRELKKSLSNTSKKQLLFYVKLRKTSLFGCSKSIKIKLKATNDLLEIFTYEEKVNQNDKTAKVEICNESSLMTLKADNIITISIYQKTITDKNSFTIAYYEKNKSEVKYIRFSCDNRFECERYYVKLKELYGKTSEYFNDAYEVGKSEEVVKISNLQKNKLLADPRNFYYSLRVIEEIMVQKPLSYKNAFIKFLIKENKENDDEEEESDRI